MRGRGQGGEPPFRSTRGRLTTNRQKRRGGAARMSPCGPRARVVAGYGVGFLSTYTPSRRGSPRTPTYLPCSIRARVASDMIVDQVRGSLLTLTIANLSWHAMEVSIQERDHHGRTARHHSRGSGKPSHRDWLLVPVVPATGTNGRCLEEVAIKMPKLDHHASEAASSISQRRPPR